MKERAILERRGCLDTLILTMAYGNIVCVCVCVCVCMNCMNVTRDESSTMHQAHHLSPTSHPPYRLSYIFIKVLFSE